MPQSLRYVYPPIEGFLLEWEANRQTGPYARLSDKRERTPEGFHTPGHVREAIVACGGLAGSQAGAIVLDRTADGGPLMGKDDLHTLRLGMLHDIAQRLRIAPKQTDLERQCGRGQEHHGRRHVEGKLQGIHQLISPVAEIVPKLLPGRGTLGHHPKEAPQVARRVPLQGVHRLEAMLDLSGILRELV